MPCGCKKGHGVSFRGAGVRKRKRGGMSISGAGYKKRRKGRRKKRKGGGWGTNALMFGPAIATLGSVTGAALGRVGRRTGIIGRVRANFKKGKTGGGGRFLSGAVWHGYGKGSGMAVSGAGLYGKRLLGRGGAGRRQI